MKFDGVGIAGETKCQRFDCLRRTCETYNLIQVARMLGTTALKRQETRGGHFRLDFPEPDDQTYLNNFVVWRDGEQCRAEMRPVPARDEVAPPPPGEHSTLFSLD